MLYQRAEFAKEIPTFSTIPTGGSFVLYLEFEDIKEEWAKIKDRVTTIQPLRKTNYGSQEFTIQDLNGYYLMFGQRS